MVDKKKSGKKLPFGRMTKDRLVRIARDKLLNGRRCVGRSRKRWRMSSNWDEENLFDGLI